MKHTSRKAICKEIRKEDGNQIMYESLEGQVRNLDFSLSVMEPLGELKQGPDMLSFASLLD